LEDYWLLLMLPTAEVERFAIKSDGFGTQKRRVKNDGLKLELLNGARGK